MLVLRLLNKRPISSKKDASSSSSSSMLCSAKGTNEVKGTLTSISSTAEVVVFPSASSVTSPRLHATAVDCAHELINWESGTKGEAGKII